jgi:EAL domain-containing protein (putative c-di-GMP-specific phosphodiesterase class I)
VDDFGTGYSSLSYLKRFPIDTLKIDQAFVADVGSADGGAIVDAIIALAKTLNLQVVAEGVETIEQVEYLMAQDCQLLQGFYFSKAVPVAEVPAQLQTDYSKTFNRVRSA